MELDMRSELKRKILQVIEDHSNECINWNTEKLMKELEPLIDKEIEDQRKDASDIIKHV
jgi:hypothetical protein